ncbi:glycosyltransferase [Paenibacillus thiaminolyticus]|uniref:glycosyltransferase n=1 Tax=Paenibacillus thiaminolyticus TaxID=49283 RepID=UPI0023506A5D|nr:glycosyltransferase [Paenibacillus thiaminolyticus]WCR28553.1 glycosyltransferase [Paenibacillus thiaminolyticus]
MKLKVNIDRYVHRQVELTSFGGTIQGIITEVGEDSTDDSLLQVENWLQDNWEQVADRTFITVPLPRNIGYAGAVTTGLYLASGEYVAAQDADDISHHERLERQVSFLEGRPDIKLVGTNYEV